jgi:hypothetical protein
VKHDEQGQRDGALTFCFAVLFPSIGLIRVPAVSGLAGRSMRVGEIANRQNTEATDYTETTRIRGVHVEGSRPMNIIAFC